MIHRRRFVARFLGRLPAGLFGEDLLDHLLGHPQPVQVVFGLGQPGAQMIGAFNG